LESPRANGVKLNVALILDMLPSNGSIPKNIVVERLRAKGIGEKRARTFLSDNLAPMGPIHEWHIKRSGKRDDTHLAEKQRPMLQVSGSVVGTQRTTSQERIPLTAVGRWTLGALHELFAAPTRLKQGRANLIDRKTLLVSFPQRLPAPGKHHLLPATLFGP
jgi:hypothetical protein